MKLNCIIDACSYIYLHQSKFNVGGKEYTLFSFFSKFITLMHSNVVNKEISNNFSDEGEAAMERSKRNYKFKKRNYKLSDYDNKLFGGTILSSPPQKDRGEKANLAVGLDIIIRGNLNSVVYLSDDRKAISENSKLFEIFEAFPYFPIWTSFEVILFLYLVGARKGYTLDLAENSIKDINSFLFQPRREKTIENYEKGIIDRDKYSQRMQTLNEAAQKQEVFYRKRLQLVKKIIE